MSSDLNMALIGLAADSHASGNTIDDVQLMETLSEKGFIFHDSERTAEIIVKAAYRAALGSGSDVLAGMIAEAFVDEAGLPLIRGAV